METGEIDEPQLALESALDLLANVGVESVPLVYGHHQRPPGFTDESGNVGILLGNVLPRIEHQDNHLRVLDRLQCLDHRELLDGFEDSAAAAQAGGVNQRVFLAAALEIDFDGIARRSRLVESDDPVFAKQRVDQRALADVWPADDGDLDHVALGLAFHRFGTRFERQVDECAHSLAVSCGNRHWLTEPQFVEIRDDDTDAHPFRLVDGHQNRPVDLAQTVGDLLVQRGEAAASIDDENHDIGLVDRLLGLACHVVHDAILGERFEAAGVDHQIRFAAEFPVSVMAVARQPGEIGDECIAGPGQAVEEG